METNSPHVTGKPLNAPSTPLQPPDEFDFPFVPYDIQRDFMKGLYEAIEGKKVGIFESPTGTGKSMSIICGALTWLRDNDRRLREELQLVLSNQKENIRAVADGEKESSATVSSHEEPAWISEFIQKQEVRNKEKDAKSIYDKIKLRDSKMKRIRDGFEQDSSEPIKKRAKYAKSKCRVKEDEYEKLLQQARRELENHDSRLSENSCDEDSSEVILEEYHSEDDTSSDVADDDEDDDSVIQKIYYCSRTHSQLTQFIKEVQKSPFGQKADKASESDFHVAVVPLASRQSMCTNEAVRRLSSVQQINERCLDLQKSSKKEDVRTPHEKKSMASCPFYKAQRRIENLSEAILGKIQDIEEIVKAGKENTACPYYAARHAVPMAQLVVVPYQMLLHSPTRKASGIKLKDAVVIVDEAHNLVDVISNIHSFEITCAQVLRAHNQLTQYSQRFSKRLKAKNLMYVKQILFVLKKLLSVMGFSSLQFNSEARGHTASDEVGAHKENLKTTLMTIHDFLFKANMDNINLFKVLRYCKRSRISQKLNGFVEKFDHLGPNSKPEPSSLTKFILDAKKNPEVRQEMEVDVRSAHTVMRSPLMHIESFLSSLTSANEDGRVAVTAEAEKDQAKTRELASIKYLLLNPAKHFKDVINECRSLIVAGGTMKPSSSFINQLLVPAGVPPNRVFEFSCGHVIKKDQLLPIVLGHGPSGADLEFTFIKRNNQKLIDELGRTVCNLCNIIPGGLVCFFPSYDYERMVTSRWQETGLLSKIGIKKKIFREPKKTSQCGVVLGEYSACIQRSGGGNTAITGALLLSVVGGKMSEGINFSDDLGRCVIMVGLPYPNMHSAELKEKMSYLDSHLPRVGTKSAGQSYYENLCMKAVNQSIGRAIRHK